MGRIASVAGLRLLHRTRKPRIIRMMDKKLYLCPNVFDPRFIFTTKFFIRHMNIKENDFVLDMGTGTGIIALFAAKKAKKVIAADLNPDAVKCARKNVELNKLQNKITVRKSNLFSNIKEKFDLILFHPPYLKGIPKTMLERAWFDNGIIEEFLRQARHHISRKGRIEIACSSLTGIKPFEQLLRELNYNYKIIAKKNLLFERLFLYELYPKTI